MKGGMEHMAFYWGKESQILFSGWPGRRGLRVYLLALFLVAAAAFIAESLSLLSRRLAPNPSSVVRSRILSGLALSAVHTLRMTLHYAVMLSVMSFNVGVLVAAVAGHAVGFFVSRGGLFSCPKPAQEDKGAESTPLP